MQRMRMSATGQVGVYTSGLWRLRAEIKALTGRRPVRRRWSARGLDEIAGWGHKPTARRARALAARAGVPYAAIEDGFFRSVRPGPGEPSASYVCDRVGIYYDARGPSALEALALARAADPGTAAQAAAPAFEAMRARGLSKYNLFGPAHAALAGLPEDPARVVLVIDQTEGDASIEGARADADTFARMLAAAATENPDAVIALKTHPETHVGRRRGMLGAQAVARARTAPGALGDAARAGRVMALSAPVRPRDLLARVGSVYAVSSLLGLEAMIHGRPVICFGQAFYSGWGLTDDRAPPTGRRQPIALECLVAATFIDYSRYFCPITRRPQDASSALETLDRLAGEEARRA